MRFLPCGSRSVLVELSDIDEVLGLYASLRRRPIEAVEQVVPGARTVLLSFDPGASDRARIEREVRERPLDTAWRDEGELVEVPVRYDGPDLPDVARMTGLTVEEVIVRHTQREHLVAFGGFAPGWAYITGVDPLLHLPRREDPRVRVPDGAVAIAGGFTGVYPRPSPGGWHVLGHAQISVWDVDRDPPALLTPGAKVRFVEVAP
jgi:KipI family sensor histidine kinase inhibitor